MQVSYYPGCSLEATAVDYAESIEAVCQALDIELNELPDWNCCGATAGHSLDHKITLNLAARNLAQAAAGPQPLVIPCALCFNRLAAGRAELMEDASLVVPEVARLGQDYEKVEILELNTFLTSPEIIELARGKAVKKLAGLKPVAYYGCQGQRPPKITGHKRPENPMGLDDMAAALGAEVRDWAFKTDCCSASHAMGRPDLLQALVGALYERALKAGANCFVTGCQMCQANLDMYQKEIAKAMGREIYLPVFYFTELMGLALGLGETKKWLSRHFVDPKPLLAELDIPL